MRAVVLVGGFGTRLRPLTEDIPKPLLPVGQRPIIEHVVRSLAAGGVTEVVLALGFRPDAFSAAYPDGTCDGVPLRYAVEPEPLDTGGAISFAAREAGIDDTFFVVNGDVLTDLDVRALLAFHREQGAQATIHLTPVEDPSSFGVAALDAEGRVLRFVEKPPRDAAPSNMINAGTYVFEPSMIDRVPVGGKVSIERVVFPAVAAESRLYALCTDDYWIDTGRPEYYRQANLDAVSGFAAPSWSRGGGRARRSTARSTAPCSGPGWRWPPEPTSGRACSCPAPAWAGAPWWSTRSWDGMPRSVRAPCSTTWCSGAARSSRRVSTSPTPVGLCPHERAQRAGG